MSGDTLNGQLRALEKRVEALEDALRLVDKLEKQVDLNAAAVVELGRILKGDEALNVPPLRHDVETLRDSIERIENVWDRAKWVALALTLTSAGQAITWIATLIQSLP